jgi:hypothetical protein
MTQATKEPDLFSDEVRTKVRKAFRAGKRTIELEGKKFNIERGRGKAGKPFILIIPVSGMLPMAQIEIEHFGSSKVKDKKGQPFIKVGRNKGS